MDEKLVFNTARKISDESARDEYLKLACGDDATALNRIRELLVEINEDSSFLEPPSLDIAETQSLVPETSRIGQRIGPYKLLQEIGEGGMGSVYMAEQEEPVRRRVALKIIKPGKADKQFIARFEAERQALAMMDHQNIAKVLDAGQAVEGSPYLVMELVQGIPITKYCDRNKLTPRQRLELFVPVCRAIQHAHQKGIIHRDLKPANVLVCIQDGKPVPKVIDFGLAKPLHHQVKLTDKTMFTEFGQVLGTVQYMSPEQAALDALDIDTRSDVYSLGIMLYELLSGSTPVDQETLKQNALLKVLEIIREDDPPRPSARLSSSKENLSAITEQRQIQASKLEQMLRDELDWIVMKALEKDRTRRYSTANDFAEDVERYLSGDAVEARPPTTYYRLAKFVKKRKALLCTLGSIVLLLLALTTVSIWAWIRVNGLYVESRANEEQAIEQKRIANEHARLAKEQEQRATELARHALNLIEEVQSAIGANVLGHEELQLAIADTLKLYPRLRLARGRYLLSIGRHAEAFSVLDELCSEAKAVYESEDSQSTDRVNFAKMAGLVGFAKLKVSLNGTDPDGEYLAGARELLTNAYSVSKALHEEYDESLDLQWVHSLSAYQMGILESEAREF